MRERGASVATWVAEADPAAEAAPSHSFSLVPLMYASTKEDLARVAVRLCKLCGAVVLTS